MSVKLTIDKFNVNNTVCTNIHVYSISSKNTFSVKKGGQEK